MDRPTCRPLSLFRGGHSDVGLKDRSPMEPSRKPRSDIVIPEPNRVRYLALVGLGIGSRFSGGDSPPHIHMPYANSPRDIEIFCLLLLEASITRGIESK